MGKVKQIEIENRTYFFYNDIINIEEFNSSLLKIDKKSYKDIDIYYVGYITILKTGDFENMFTVNPSYLIIGEVDGHVEENNGNKYLAFDSVKLRSTKLHSTEENKEVFKKYAELLDGIKNEIETINGGKKGEYVNKTSASKEWDICHYWYFKDIGFKYEPHLCNGCHDLMRKARIFNDVDIIYNKGNAYRIHFCN